LVRGWVFEMPGQIILVNGEDVTVLTRTEGAGRGASRVGTFPEVREHLKREQRRLADDRDIVCEGRDQGTAVFPTAPVKFFFRASVQIRADRRARELRDRGQAVDLAQIAEQIAARDLQDENRAIDPLRQPADAMVLDTTHLSPDDVFDRMLAAVNRCRSMA
jgi:cytidylate kinase